VRVLLDGGASVDVRDKEGRTALLFLASEKSERLRIDTLRMLLERGADMEARDAIGRTPLLWAATNGNVKLVRALLSGELCGQKADIEAANNRGRNALHLAAESNHEEMVRLLLRFGADPTAVSDGGWTALHNAAQNGYKGIVALLMGREKVDVNVELSNGMTPLHWAAFNGHEEVVRLLLAMPETDISIRDSFDRTPLLCAAEMHHKDIAQILSPARAAGRLSPTAQRACKEFEATVVDFGNFRDGKKQLVFKHSVHELLYGWDEDTNKPTVSTVPKNVKYQPAFRWIHLPANNIAWVETLLAKNFVENSHKDIGARDIEPFKALEKTFDQEHRGKFAHAHFMRTFSHRIPASPNHEREEKEKTLISVAEEQSDVSTTSQATLVTTPKKAPENATPTKGDNKKKSKAEQIAERHPKRSKRTSGPPGNPPGTKLAARSASQLSFEATKSVSLNGKIVLFMPFLHYETNERRRKLSAAISAARSGSGLPQEPTRDDLLIHAYATNMPPLHPRRTLDQYFYHGIDTSVRDTDQVVYRYCKRFNIEPKVFMVDQLWLYILGKDLVITCFPQRWDQPKHDPLNVLDGILEWTNAKTRPPVQSVYDLAMTITNRCSGMFDRHRLDDSDYQFLDIFESSIGRVTNRESQLFDRFNTASRLSGQWLQRHRQLQLGLRPRKSPERIFGTADVHGQDPLFPDVLLDIGVETSLLAEIKDIRDELNIIAVILAQQTNILEEFESHMTDELRSESSRRSPVTETLITEIRRRSREQGRLLTIHQNDIQRMDRQAESIYTSLTHLLDLKQKHSNALEARFARDQAVIAAKQGQTIMVFTIVTIIFLPMSFIAAFFAINFEEWGAGLRIGYVSKYLFGIGLGVSVPLIAMAFTVTDIFDMIKGLPWVVRGWSRRVKGMRRGKGRREEEEKVVGG
jgi:ankyrin repeat protein/Mg2+ and Co2+ transporter CorA